jgi:hypothetical protein
VVAIARKGARRAGKMGMVTFGFYGGSRGVQAAPAAASHP